MKSLLSDIELGTITSKFNINNLIIRVKYRTGNVINHNDHIWLSDIVLANHIMPSGSIGCYEYGVGYVSAVFKKSGYDVKSYHNSNNFIHNCELNNQYIDNISDDDRFDNLIFTSDKIYDIKYLEKWNRNGRVIIAVDDEIDASIIANLRNNKIHYNIYPISSNVIAASDGSKLDYKINIINITSADYSCIYRSSDPIRNEECQSCNNSKIVIDIYKCELHGECSVGGSKYRSCIVCSDRQKS